MIPHAATFDLVDWRGRVTVFEGYNDDLAPKNPDAPSTVSGNAPLGAVVMQQGRRGSPFTGAEASIAWHDEATMSSQTLALTARGLHYTPPGGSLGGDAESLSLGWGGTVRLSPRDQLDFGEIAVEGDEDAMRFADSPVTALDLALGRRRFVASTTILQWTHEETTSDRERVVLGFGIRDITSDASTISAFEGVDYVAPTAEFGYAHDFSARDSGEALVLLRSYHLPHAILDVDGRRGQSSTLQLEPRARFTHALSEAWGSAFTAGVAFANTSRESQPDALYVTPTAGAELRYARDPVRGACGYLLGFTAATPSSLPGISQTFSLTASAKPFASGPARDWALLGTALGGLTYIPTGSDVAMLQTSAGATLAAAVPIARWLGLYVAYEGRIDRVAALGASTPPIALHRNLAFLGLSGSFTTDGEGFGLGMPASPLARQAF